MARGVGRPLDSPDLSPPSALPSAPSTSLYPCPMSAHDSPQPQPWSAPSSTLGQVSSTYCVSGTVMGNGDAERS